MKSGSKSKKTCLGPRPLPGSLCVVSDRKRHQIMPALPFPAERAAADRTGGSCLRNPAALALGSQLLGQCRPDREALSTEGRGG